MKNVFGMVTNERKPKRVWSHKHKCYMLDTELEKLEELEKKQEREKVKECQKS
jgi:hypothetical protein